MIGTLVISEAYDQHNNNYFNHPLSPDDDVCPLPLDAVGFINKLWKKNDLKVYFLTPHPDEDLIISWASEWSNYCAITFTKTTDVTQSDVRVAFNDGIVYTVCS